MESNAAYKARVLMDKAIKQAIRDQVEVLARALLGSNEIDITKIPEGLDRNNPRLKYIGRWKNIAVMAESITGIYLEVIRVLSPDDSMYFPIISFKKESPAGGCNGCL